MKLFDYIRDVPDFPKPGVMFKDMTPLMADPSALDDSIMRIVAPFRAEPVDLVAGMEARGFIFGALAAKELACGFVPLRKPGKLPGATETVSYDLEYGSAALEAHRDAFRGHPQALTFWCPWIILGVPWAYPSLGSCHSLFHNPSKEFTQNMKTSQHKTQQKSRELR